MSAALLVERANSLATGSPASFVTGDLNTFFGDPRLGPMMAAYSDDRATAPETDDVVSFNGWGAASLTLSIDFIFFRNTESLRFQTIDDEYGVAFISEHYPMIAEFELTSVNDD